MSILVSLREVDRARADADLLRETLAAALGRHTCWCGGFFDFTTDSTLEDYAALNRWVGYHGRCGEVDQ